MSQRAGTTTTPRSRTTRHEWPLEGQTLSISTLPRVRIGLSLAFILAVSLVLFSLISAIVLVALQSSWLAGDRPSHAQTLARTTADYLSQLPSRGWEHRATIVLRDLAAQETIAYASLHDTDGSEIAFAGRRPGDMNAQKRSPVQALNIYDYAVRGPAGRGYVLRLGAANLESKRAMSDGTIAIGAGLLVSACFGLPAMAFRMRRTARRLHTLHMALRRLSLDAPIRPVPVTGDDEIAYLCVAFNGLAARITEQRLAITDTSLRLGRQISAQDDANRCEIESLKDRLSQQRTASMASSQRNDALINRMKVAITETIAACNSIAGDTQKIEAATDSFRSVQRSVYDIACTLDVAAISGLIGAGGAHARRETTDLLAVLDRVEPMLVARAALRGVSIRLERPRRAISVHGNSELVECVLMALSAASVSASEHGCELVLRVGATAGVAAISMVPSQASRTRPEQRLCLQPASCPEVVVADELSGAVAACFGKLNHDADARGFTLHLPLQTHESIVDSFVRTVKAYRSSDRVWVVSLPASVAGGTEDALNEIATHLDTTDLLLVSDDCRWLLAAGDASSSGSRSRVEAWLTNTAVGGHDKAVDRAAGTIECGLNNAKACIINTMRFSERGTQPLAA